MNKSQIIALALTGFIAVGCSNMNNTQQRAVSGGAIGAAAGGALGWMTGHTVAGALIGAAAGTAGGLIVDSNEKSNGRQ